jgi:RNA-directed DNA polymerase
MPLQSDLSPARTLLDDLTADEPWQAAVDLFRQRNPRRLERLAEYEQLLKQGDHRRVVDAVLAGGHCPEPPREAWLNKADGRKKRIFRYPPLDELLFRVVNRLVQPVAAEVASPWCRSFLPGGGARSAFRGVLTDADIAGKGALRLDIRDYFNSIDVDDLLARLPAELTAGPLGPLLRAALRDPRVERAGAIVDGGQKGVMAGTPLAPVLATLYLRDLDYDMAAGGATYSRYSDDILVLAPPAELPDLGARARRLLAERGLAVNERKSRMSAPGEPWDFLGFRYTQGVIGLAPTTERKFKAKATRLARSMLRWRDREDVPSARVTETYCRRTNLRLFGVPAERAEFSWATWFLPMLRQPDGLPALDAHVRREARYATTGSRRPRAHELVPYAALAEAGHLPLVTAFWTMHEGGPAAYDALVARRTGLS